VGNDLEESVNSSLDELSCRMEGERERFLIFFEPMSEVVEDDMTFHLDFFVSFELLYIRWREILRLIQLELVLTNRADWI